MIRIAFRLTLLAATAGLAACTSTRPPLTTGSTYPMTVPERHPIVLADSSRNLDVFVTGTGHIDPRQADDVDGFLTEYRRYGRGVLVFEVPRGSQVSGVAVERTLQRVRGWIRPAIIIVPPEGSSIVVSDLRTVRPGTEIVLLPFETGIAAWGSISVTLVPTRIEIRFSDCTTGVKLSATP